MVSRCANPECGARFHYLSQGRLFHFEVGAHASDRAAVSGPRLVAQKKSVAKIEHFWLCSKCASTMTLKQDKNEVVVIPLENRLRAAAS